MAVRYFLLEDLDRVVKVDGSEAWVCRDGAWHERAHVWRNSRASAGTPTVGRSQRPKPSGSSPRATARRFIWSKQDLQGGGVYFHDGEREGNEDPER